MLKKIYKVSFFFLIILLLPPSVWAQTIGELFISEKADELFGEVLTSVNIESSVLKELTDKTESVLMFGIIENELVIAGDNRKVLYPENFLINEETELYLWSTDIILELLEKGKQDFSAIENRKEVMSITNGQQTLETGNWCPPFCSVTKNLSAR